MESNDNPRSRRRPLLKTIGAALVPIATLRESRAATSKTSMASSHGGGDAHTVMVVANGPTEYSITVDGTIEADENSGDFSSESGDTTDQNANGDAIAIDVSGPAEEIGGFRYLGDSYRFEGTVKNLDLQPRDPLYDYNVYLDGHWMKTDEVISGEYSAGPHSLILSANGPTEYEIVVDGALTPMPDNGDFSSEGDETIAENRDGTVTASDSTGPTDSSGSIRLLGDRYNFEGELSDYTLNPKDPAYEAFIYVDERYLFEIE